MNIHEKPLLFCIIFTLVGVVVLLNIEFFSKLDYNQGGLFPRNMWLSRFLTVITGVVFTFVGLYLGIEFIQAF